MEKIFTVLKSQKRLGGELFKMLVSFLLFIYGAGLLCYFYFSIGDIVRKISGINFFGGF